MNSQRSASVGALPREKKHFVSRNESGSGMTLDVRCACQYFESDSLLPERVNPVDSRPSSKLGFHEHGVIGESSHHFHPMNEDALSTRSFNVAGHVAPQQRTEFDRLSMHSVGAQRSWDQAPPVVDLAFVEKYPELEETARKRGLIVRTISDATEGEMLVGHRRRQMSVSGMSTGSAGRRDPETWSMRSGISVRRISRSPSKADLFVADINIPSTRTERYEQRSRSVSRRASNIDLSHFSSHQPSPAPVQIVPTMASAPMHHQQLKTPQVNLIAPTPSPGATEGCMDFSQAISANVATSSPPPPQDYRIAKPPVSTDYMRPDENKENVPYYQPLGDVLPQNRPIDISKYENRSYDGPRIQASGQNDMKSQNVHTNFGSKVASPALDLDPLQRNVAELEQLKASTNLVDIHDDIKLETRKPPSVAGDTSTPSLHLNEETKISIVSSVTVVDVNALIQSEENKARENNKRSRSVPRQRSPPGNQQQTTALQSRISPSSGQLRHSDTLQLPGRDNQTLQQLKRQHTPERQLSPERSKKSALSIQQMQAERQLSPERSQKSVIGTQHLQPYTTDIHFATVNGAIPLQMASPEAKTTYASRFKSMFTHKNDDNMAGTASQRQKSASPSPKREKSPSPAPGAMLMSSVFSRTKSTPIEMKSNAIVTKKSDAEPMAVKVTETFSLKVDEMDQYCSRPNVPPPPPSHMSRPSSIYSSHEDFSISKRMSVDSSEPFAPVVIPSANATTFLAGNRTLYSSEIDTHSPRRSETELLSSSKEVSIGYGSSNFNVPKGTLISVPINIGSSASIAHSLPKVTGSSTQDGRPRMASADGRASQAKFLRKSSFRDARTQSQDRTRLNVASSHEDIYGGGRMTKTVSFNFDERQSRLSKFENSTLSQQQKEQRDFLERTYFSRDHEYEPIGVPPADDTTENEHHSLVKESSPKLSIQTNQNDSVDIEQISDEMKDAEEMQKDLEERYFSSATTTPRSESRTDYEIHTSQVDSSALEELPLKPENRKKGFIASAQDRTRKMQAGIKNQAGKIKTKLRTPTKKPTPSASPKAKDRKRFKAPEFSKLKMPEIKRPEFTKFNKPDMSKFKLPEKFSTLKLKRSKSLKETETVHPDDDMSGITPPESGVGVAAETTQPQKKLFEFNFGTYPRAFRTKKKTPVEPQSSLGTEDPSIIPSTETQPSVESSSSPQGDRGPGPVRSRWADKFSDVSYNDSEGSRYRRYGSEQESFDRESSLERRMKGDLEDETASETPELGILGGVADNKQFAEFDEENRAIHEISNLRAGEFKRRPITHQDSDLRSEDSKEAVGWTDMEIQKNKLLRKAELEAEASYLKYPSDERITQETQSTASSGKKVVMEEIDDDEFFLRKRGISEDNIELRQYISNVIREGYETPMNALEHVGHTSQPMEYGDYDIPPPKPRRLHKTYRPEEDSQEFDMQRSEYGDDLSMSHNGSDYFGAPKRPLRKGRSRSKYSMDSQDIPMADQSISNAPYFDDDEEYLRPPRNLYKDTQEHDDLRLNNLDVARKDYFTNEEENENAIRPQAPTRRKRHLRDSSMDKDSYINGFSGRSISNSYLQPSEDVIVYRTEHEYHIPLATPEQYTNGEGSTPTRKSRSISRYEEDDQTSRGVDSLGLDAVNLKGHYDLDAMQQEVEDDNQEKFVIDMIESDGYAVVRKEQVPKPTPPARRKKFTRSPGERFVTSPNVRETTLNTPPPPERPPPPRSYTPSAVQPDEELSQRKSASLHLDANQK